MKTEMSPKRKLNRFILRTAKIVRILSVAPVPAFILFAILCFKGEMAFPWEFITAVFSISFLPLLAYPLQPVIPAFRNKGREGQRTLAMIMSSLGYVIAVAVSFIFGFGKSVKIVFITYLLSGLVLTLINKAFRFRASGHACGIAGPMGVIAYHAGPAGIIFGLGSFLLVLWSSLRLHSHTFMQYIVGALIPNVIFYAIVLFV